jgi:hypothetical protein
MAPYGGFQADEEQFRTKYSSQASAGRDRVIGTVHYENGWKAVTAICLTVMLLYNGGQYYKMVSHEEAVRVLNEADSSKGFPLKKQYEYEEPIPSEDYARLGNAIVEFWQENGFVPNICELFNKQELVKVEKFAKGDMRKIVNVSKDIQYWFVRAGKQWHDAHQQMYRHGPFAVGINPSSLDWDMLFKRHNKFPNHFHGDVKGCEFTFTTQSIREIFKVRRTVSDPDMWPLLDMLESAMVDKIIKSPAGTTSYCPALNPSGVYDTTHNTDLHVLRMCMSFFSTVLGSGLRDWEEEIALTIYGDNILVSYSDAVSEKGLSPVKFTEYLQSEGVVIKCSPQQALVECEFLSQRFVPFFGRVMHTTHNRLKLLMSVSYTKSGKQVDPAKHANKIYAIWQHFIFGSEEDYAFIQRVAGDFIAAYGKVIPSPPWLRLVAKTRIPQGQAQLWMAGLQCGIPKTGPWTIAAPGLKEIYAMPSKKVKKEVKHEAKAEAKKEARHEVKKKAEMKHGGYSSVSRAKDQSGKVTMRTGSGNTSLREEASKHAMTALQNEQFNADQWVMGLRDPFGAGIRQRVPDSSCAMPTYAFPLILRGKLPAVIPSGATSNTEVAIQVFPDPYYGAQWLTAEATAGAWTTCAIQQQPSNLSVLTAQAALYRTVSVGLRIYNTSAIQARGGDFWVFNNFCSQYYGGGAGGFSGVTPTILGSAQQVLRGDAAALGGDGLRFNWLPLTDRNDLVPYNSNGQLGFTALCWRAPGFVTNTAGTIPSSIQDAALFFRALVTNNTTTAIDLDFEIIWNVEAIVLAASDQSYPGKVLSGSSSSVTNAIIDLEGAGSKTISAQVSLPGMVQEMSRGGAPSGTTTPQPLFQSALEKAGASAGKWLGGTQIGKTINGAFDMISGLFNAQHKVAVFAGYPELSPVWRSHRRNMSVHKRMRSSWVIDDEHQRTMEEFLEFILHERKLVDMARKLSGCTHVSNYEEVLDYYASREAPQPEWVTQQPEDDRKSFSVGEEEGPDGYMHTAVKTRMMAARTQTPVVSILSTPTPTAMSAKATTSVERGGK